MVQLRVDVEAAGARREFENAARGVESLRDSMSRAERESEQLNRAYTEASNEAARMGRRLNDAQQNLNQLAAASAAADREVDRLQGELRRLGSAAPQQLRDDFAAAQREARRLTGEVRDANREVTQLSRDTVRANEALRNSAQAANHAGDEVRRMAHEMHMAQLRANLLRHTMNRLDADANRATNRMQRGLLGFRAEADRLMSQGIGTTISSSLRSAWQAVPTEIKGVVILAGAAVAATFVVAAAAVIQAALLTAVGGAVLGLGVMLAAKTSAAVKTAFAGAFDGILKDVRAFSLIFERPLVGAARIFGDTWNRISGDVRGVFQDLSGAIEPLADGISGMVENAMPGFRQAIAASLPLLKQLARSLPEIGTALSNFFGSIAAGDGAAKGLKVIIQTVMVVLIGLGNIIEYLSNKFDQLTTGLEVVLTVMSKIPGIGDGFALAAQKMRDFNNVGEPMLMTLDQTATASDGTAGALGREADAAKRAAAEMQKLSAKLAALIGDQMNADQAAIAWEAAIDGVTASVREQGRTIDIGTEKGRANVGVVLQAISAAEQQRQAAIALAGGQNASAAAVENANAKFRAQLGQLEAVLRAAGLTKAQIDALLGKYREMANAPDISKNITVYYRTSGSGAAVAAGGGTPRSIPGSKVFFRQGGIAYADQGLINLSGKAGMFSAGQPIYGFAEAGTGGEAFVARNAPHSRSLAIADQAARWHGGRVTTGRGGGGSAQLQLVAGAGGDGLIAGVINKLVRTGQLKLKVVGSRVVPA